MTKTSFTEIVQQDCTNALSPAKRPKTWLTLLAILPYLAACLASTDKKTHSTQNTTRLPPIVQNCPNAPELMVTHPTTKNRTVITIKDEAMLQRAMKQLKPNTTLVLAPGIYRLSHTLQIKQDNITLRGEKNDCQSTRLIGRGMENADFGTVPHGIWINANNSVIAHLSIESVYHHSIQYDPRANNPLVYQVNMLDAGEQFVKASPKDYGNGVDNGRVAYSIMAYTNGPPVTDHGGGGAGYTNGVDVHAGRNWIVEHNVFYGFYTPDNSDHRWSPAVLFWNGASGTITRSNRFVNVNRAIAYGLTNRSAPNNLPPNAQQPHHHYADHAGGQIINNMVYLEEGLFSNARKRDSDASIIVWDSPNTLVAHNTILNNGNHYFAVEARFNSEGVVIKNNLADAKSRMRKSRLWDKSASGNPVIEHNHNTATPELFLDPKNADLRLRKDAVGVDLTLPNLRVPFVDIDGHARNNPTVFAGADEPF